MQRAPITVPESVATGAIGTNFVRTTKPKAGLKDGEGEDPILMLHGFDSSLLEFRRLMPKLGELGAEAYAVDVLGWGFTQLSGVSSFGAGTRVFVSLELLRCPVVSIRWLTPSPIPTSQTHGCFEVSLLVLFLLLAKGFDGIV